MQNNQMEKQSDDNKQTNQIDSGIGKNRHR